MDGESSSSEPADVSGDGAHRSGQTGETARGRHHLRLARPSEPTPPRRGSRRFAARTRRVRSCAAFTFRRAGSPAPRRAALLVGAARRTGPGGSPSRRAEARDPRYAERTSFGRLCLARRRLLLLTLARAGGGQRRLRASRAGAGRHPSAGTYWCARRGARRSGGFWLLAFGVPHRGPSPRPRRGQAARAVRARRAEAPVSAAIKRPEGGEVQAAAAVRARPVRSRRQPRVRARASCRRGARCTVGGAAAGATPLCHLLFGPNSDCM